MTKSDWTLLFTTIVMAVVILLMVALLLSNMVQDIMLPLFDRKFTCYRLEVSLPAATSEAEIERQMMLLARFTKCSIIYRTSIFTYRADHINGFRKAESP